MFRSSFESVNPEEGMDTMTICIIIFIILLAVTLIVLLGYYGYVLLSSNPTVSPSEILNKNRPQLIEITNVPMNAKQCIAEQTYGIDANNEFYVDKGCSGIFVFATDNADRNRKIGVCTTNNTSMKKCPIYGMVPTTHPNTLTALAQESKTDDLSTVNNSVDNSVNDPPIYNSLNGFIDMRDSNISILEQNGNCRPYNYGFYGNNMIYTEGGCRGVFAVGPLIGKCESKETNEKTLCPIGNVDFNGNGLVLGLIKPYDTSSMCNRGGKYGFKTRDMAFRDPIDCNVGGLVFDRFDSNGRLINGVGYGIDCPLTEEDCSLNQNVVRVQTTTL